MMVDLEMIWTIKGRLVDRIRAQLSFIRYFGVVSRTCSGALCVVAELSVFTV